MNTAVATQLHKMALTACSSSQIHAHGFDTETGTLVLQFKRKNPDDPTGPRIGGSKYSYPCSPEKYALFCAAESKGTFFGAHIENKPDEHPHTKLPDETDDES